MVYYTDSPQINRRMVAGYYLFLCLVGFAILLGPTGAGITVAIISNDGRDHELAFPGTHDSPDDCNQSGCHQEEFAYWNQTAHATHMGSFSNATDDYITIGSHWTGTEAFFNSTCSECHTSGWDNSTGTPTYDALGVNCFACHNSTGSIDYNGTACENCHRASGPTHPNQAAAYSNSAHANSLADLRTSSHAGSSCMHCMSTEGFIHQEDDFEVDGPYNPIGCPACHAIHSNWSIAAPGQIRAVNATQLCASCHVGSRHTTYNVWYGGAHHLAGVECIDCHGFDYAVAGDTSTQFLNHTFIVNPEEACGQSEECHEGLEEWALGQLESHQSAYTALVEEITTEADDLSAIVLAYNATEGADHELVAEVMDIIDDVEGVVSTQEGDLSEGFHDFSGIMSDLNAAYADLLNAKAYFYENTPPATVTNTVTVTVTTTVTGPGGTLFGMDATLVLIGGSVGGIVIGLILGVLVGRRG